MDHGWLQYYQELSHMGRGQVNTKKWFKRQSELDLEYNYHQKAEQNYERSWTSYVIAVWEMAKNPKQEHLSK